MIGWLIFALISIGILAICYWKKKYFDLDIVLGIGFEDSKKKWLKKLPRIPFIYILMQKSKFGIAWCDRLVKKHPKLIKATKWPIVVLGVLLINVTVLTIIWAVHDQIMKEINKVAYQVSSVALILPINVESKAVFYVPFFYWIIGIFAVIIIHEGGHAIFTRYLKVPIHSTGLAIMSILIPIIPAAYVKPDEKALEQQKTSDKLWVFAAGSVFNILASGVFFIALIGVSIIGFIFGLSTDWPVQIGPLWWIVLYNTISILFAFNLGIGLMNLLPMVPLDGGLMIKEIFSELNWKPWSWKAVSVGSLMILLAAFFAPPLVKYIIGG
jgi:Zn-dependent protease